jgi:hypothetical protein
MLPTRFAAIQHGIWLSGALSALVLAGCLAAPKQASKITPEPVTQTSHQGVKIDLVMPAGYWKQSGPADAAQIIRNSRRAVITEFAVELIDLQSQGPFERQMAVNPPPMIFGPLISLDGLTFIAALSVNVVGLGRNNVQMSDDKQQALAGSLYNYYESDLLRRGLAVVPTSALLASPGYARFKAKPVVKSSLLKLLNPVGNDTGVVLRSRMVGAPGLGVVTCGVSERSAAEDRILRDTGADVAVGVRLRVGSFHKKAALEQGSVIRLTTAEGTSLFTAKHSILSDADVITEPHFKIFTGHIEPVVPDEFIRELASMLPKFLDLAIREPIPGPGALPQMTRLPPVEETMLR